METKDLMISDWVMYKNEPIMVWEIDDYYYRINTEPDGYNAITCVEISDVTPIPLTPEILEKNGFVKMSKSPYVMLYMWSTGGVAEFADVTIQVGQDHADKWRWDCLTLKIHLYRGDITLHKIRYIHELQHALRLCGIKKEIEL